MASPSKEARKRKRWGGKRGLVIELAEESAAALRAIALYPDGRADHVTLAFGVDQEEFSPDWVPGGHAVGARIELLAKGTCADGRVQAVLIEIGGVTTRPWDGSILHVTISKLPTARSSESNALLRSAALEPLDLRLEGVVVWTGETTEPPSV